MRKLVLVAFWLAGAACSSSSGAGQGSALVGDWAGQGISIENWTYTPGPGTYLFMASFRQVTFTTDGSGAIGLVGPYPVLAEPVPMQSGGPGVLFLAGPFTVSRPAAPSCGNTPCVDQTDVVTVTSGWAGASDGILDVALAGERVLCCQHAAFTVGFVGTNPGASSN